jgi:hypothetical protein
MKNIITSLGSARPSDSASLPSSSSSDLFQDTDSEYSIVEGSKEEEKGGIPLDDSIYEEIMVPNEIVVSTEIPLVAKVPEIIKSHQKVLRPSMMSRRRSILPNILTLW